MNEYTNLVFEPLDTNKLNSYLDGKPNIVLQKDIATMNDIEQVFNGNNYAIIFTATNAENDGHFQCIFKNNKRIYFFDSYGMMVDELINKLIALKRPLFGQNNNLLRLIVNSTYYKQNKVFINTFKYQSNNINVSTCGRYCVLLIILNIMFSKKKKSFDFNTFHNLMILWKNKYRKSYDQIVSFLIADDVL
jgi:hypothetical protein